MTTFHHRHAAQNLRPEQVMEIALRRDKSVGQQSGAEQEFLEGLSQRIATTLWCGNLKVSPMAFTGLRALSGNIANDGVA